LIPACLHHFSRQRYNTGSGGDAGMSKGNLAGVPVGANLMGGHGVR
jgi:hypothetical protein